MKIVDLSHYNTVTDFNKLFNDCDGIIIRLGYRGYGASGKLVYDNQFKTRIKKVIDSGLPWGVYFVTQAINKEESIAESYFIIDTLKNYNLKNLSLGIHIDSEYSNPKKNGRADKLSKRLRTDLIKESLYILKAYDFKCGVYASLDWFKNQLYLKELGCNIWVAKYGKNDGKKPPTEPNIDYDMWQYTSKGKIDGVKGDVDISVLQSTNYISTYFPKYNGDTVSIVSALNSLGIKSSFSYRCDIANANGFKKYSGTAEQNLKMLALLKCGNLKRPN